MALRGRWLLGVSLGILILALAGTLPGPAPLLWVGVVHAGAVRPDVETSTTAARSAWEKIQTLSISSSAPPVSHEPIVITDLEANSYLKYHGREFLPPGVNDPEVHIFPGRVAGNAEVNFDELNKNNPKAGDWFSSLLQMMFKGKQKVSAKGRFDISNGQAKVTFEDVEMGTTSVPDWLVSALLDTYVERRYKIDLSKPLALPDHVTRVELGEGRATFYRSPAEGR